MKNQEIKQVQKSAREHERKRWAIKFKKIAVQPSNEDFRKLYLYIAECMELNKNI